MLLNIVKIQVETDGIRGLVLLFIDDFGIQLCVKGVTLTIF